VTKSSTFDVGVLKLLFKGPNGEPMTTMEDFIENGTEDISFLSEKSETVEIEPTEIVQE